MEKYQSSQSTHADVAQPASVFAFPELFPSGMRLLLDGEAHTALFFSLDGGESLPLFRSVPLTPASATVFLALLKAYPAHCSHRSLYRALYPSAESTDDDVWWSQVKGLALPLIRRALKTLLPALRTCGLQVVSLRGQGYLLTSSTRHTKHQEEASADEQKRSSRSSVPQIRAPCFSAWRDASSRLLTSCRSVGRMSFFLALSCLPGDEAPHSTHGCSGGQSAKERTSRQQWCLPDSLLPGKALAFLLLHTKKEKV